jgi:tricorn protease
MAAGYLRYPHIHGDLLTFAAGDDIWLAPAAGGRAWRFSADNVPVSYPRFSRDGASIAWTSWRDGNPEVYSADTDGSTAAGRLTYWGDPQTRVTGWTAGGEVLAVTAADQPAQKYRRAYAVPGDGGTPPRLLPFGAVTDVAVEEAGTALLTASVVGEPAFWKRYRGGRAGKLWVATGEDPLFTRVLADLDGQLAAPMLIGDRLYFLSDHEGTGNIYSCALDGGDVRRHTDHDGMYARNPSTDGERIVYHVAGDIWVLDSSDAAQPRRLDITLGSPAAARAPRLVSASDHLGALDCDRTGRASVVEVRGTVHWLAHKDGPARALHVDPAARARLPRVLGETGQAVWVTDAGGADALEIASLEGPTVDGAGAAEGGDSQSVRLAEGLLGYVTSLAASPDGATVAAAAHDGRLLLLDVASGQVTELAAADDGAVQGLSWSPDSAWLAWSQPTVRPLTRIRLARVADLQIVDVTDGRFADSSPVFTLDGLYLAFLSQRSFDPVYDTHSFDLSFPLGGRPYLVPLAAGTPSPFGPAPGGRPLGQDNGEEPAAEAPPAPGETTLLAVPPAAAGTSPPAVVVTVDPDGLAARVVPLPVEQARYRQLHPVKGGLAWLRAPVAGVLGEGGAAPEDDGPRPALQRFDLRKREVKELAAAADWFRVSGDGTRIVLRDREELRVIPSARKDDAGEAVTVDLTRARFQADPAALWRHAYDEAGRYLRRDFWAPDMSGVDWDGVLNSYRPLLDRVRGGADVADLLWEVLGELGTSHAYVTGSWDGQWDFTPVGRLGADVSRDAAGRWVVDRVLPGESSDPRARSPLEAPGAGIGPGDELIAVDGQPVDPRRGPWPLLAGTAGKPVELTVLPRGDDPEVRRRVAIVPLRSDRRLRYQDWVASRRRLVRELGDGRLGYLHIPDMMGEGWAHFHRDLRTEMARDGLIFDVRGNSGGHISALVVEKLARRILGWSMGRYLRPEPYPAEARRGALVTVADEFAGSDGDIVAAAIKLLGLGPVVGARTWGGVIGIAGRQGLVDGSTVTVPRFAFYFDEYGWGVENHGVDPDVEVLITPNDAAAGRDTQLETAVQLALEALDKQPPPAPPAVATGPPKARRPLPPRSSLSTPSPLSPGSPLSTPSPLLPGSPLSAPSPLPPPGPRTTQPAHKSQPSLPPHGSGVS